MFGFQAALRLAYSAAEIMMLAVRLPMSTRTLSPVLSNASPPPTAASGEAFRIDGLADVPLCRPSPTHGNSRTPPFTSRSGGSMFTTSAAPG